VSRAGDVYDWVGDEPAEVSHEEFLVERVAVWQIMDALPFRHRRVLLAMAEYDGSYLKAAAALGMPAGSYYAWLAQARRAAARHWHAPETAHRAPGRRRATS